MKSLHYIVGIIAIIAIFAFFLSESSGQALSTPISDQISTKQVNDQNAQIVKMHVEGSTYVFEPSTVKKGTPVKIEADISRMPGCSKGIVSAELGIRKTFSSSDNTFVFTPSKAGTFYIACSMNMYKGTLTVLESDGSKASYVELPKAGGISSGGCGGCGG
jgi:plastocyanin domain-containing protein